MTLQELIHENQKIYIGSLRHSIGLKKSDNEYVLYNSNSGSGEIVCHSIEELALKIELIFHDEEVAPYTGITIQVIESNECKSNCDYQSIKNKLVTNLINKRKEENNLDVKDWKNSSLVLATAVNDVQTATALIEAGANVNMDGVNDLSTPPLLIAAQFNCVELVEKLISAGADIDCVINGEFPLLNACSHGNKDVVNMLIKHNANIIMEVEGHTALSHAASKGHLDIMEILIKHANPYFNINMMANAVMHAVDHGQLDALKYLLSLGASSEGSTWPVSMLDLAIIRGDLMMVRFLIDEYQQNITKANISGSKPLSLARYCQQNLKSVNSEAIVTYLVEKLLNDYSTISIVADNNNQAVKLSSGNFGLFKSIKHNMIAKPEKIANKNAMTTLKRERNDLFSTDKKTNPISIEQPSSTVKKECRIV